MGWSEGERERERGMQRKNERERRGENRNREMDGRNLRLCKRKERQEKRCLGNLSTRKRNDGISSTEIIFCFSNSLQQRHEKPQCQDQHTLEGYERVEQHQGVYNCTTQTCNILKHLQTETLT